MIAAFVTVEYLRLFWSFCLLTYGLLTFVPLQSGDIFSLYARARVRVCRVCAQDVIQ